MDDVGLVATRALTVGVVGGGALPGEGGAVIEEIQSHELFAFVAARNDPLDAGLILAENSVPG